MHEPDFGVSTALLTPFKADLSIDVPRMAELARFVLDKGCNSVTIFGTTGEGLSLTEPERDSAHRDLLKTGLEPEQIITGIGSTAIGSAITQAQSSLQLGCRDLLVLPPFYFKNTLASGVYAWYRQFFESIAKDDPRVILYHIPQLTGVDITPQLITDLRKEFGQMVYGVKDSSGSWPTIKKFLALDDIALINGDERCLAPAMPLGGAGTISGVSNLVAAKVAAVWNNKSDDDAVMQLIDAIVSVPIIPALKTLLAHLLNDKDWERVRAPLVPLNPEQREQLLAEYHRLHGK